MAIRFYLRSLQLFGAREQVTFAVKLRINPNNIFMGRISPKGMLPPEILLKMTTNELFDRGIIMRFQII
jgi:hypothetical protein